MSELVRAAFTLQADACSQLGSPFTARVCRLCAARLQPSTAIGAEILDWPGDPSYKGDSLPLRVTGALHELARSGKSPRLQAVYPPHTSDDETLWLAIDGALTDHADLVRSYLTTPPQTNEVMRSAALLPGLLTIADATALPLDLYEIGASAGLNLILDHYRYQFGTTSWGDPASTVLLKPQWQGSLPPVHAALRIRSRQGVDANPISLKQQSARDRLISYVWADQFERLQRLSAAVTLWLQQPPHIERADAALWLEASNIKRAESDVTRVLFHSLVWNYLSQETQQRITKLMQECGEQSDAQTPLAWLRFELDTSAAQLRLKLWPGGEDRLLATGHPHGTALNWLA